MIGQLVLFNRHFRLRHDPATGYTVTLYPDGASSGCGVQPGDEHHAPLLGITPGEHRVVHELLHHLVALHVLGDQRGSGVVRRDAHGTLADAPEVKPGWNENEREEWYVTALTYLLCGRPVPDPGALTDIRASGADPDEISDEARLLLERLWEGPLPPWTEDREFGTRNWASPRVDGGSGSDQIWKTPDGSWSLFAGYKVRRGLPTFEEARRVADELRRVSRGPRPRNAQ